MYASCSEWPVRGVITVLQSNINMYCFPQPAAPHLKMKLCLAAAGRTGTCELTATMKTVCSLPKSIRDNKLPPPRELHVCYQPHRLKGVPGQRSKYKTFLFRTGRICTSVYGVAGICRLTCTPQSQLAPSQYPILLPSADTHREPYNDDGGEGKLSSGQVHDC